MTLLLGPPEPFVDTGYDIIYNDAGFAVVNKPGNLPCHPAGRYYGNTLTRLLIEKENFPDAHVVNRLDRETSGLVIVAKNSNIASELGRQFMDRQVEKTYVVAVEGAFPDSELSADGWIFLQRGGIVWKKRVFTQDLASVPSGAKKCITIFKLLKTNGSISLLEARPQTGRPHQIRATLKSLGYPVIGDKLYGVDETIYARMCSDSMIHSDLERLRMGRQALHASSLVFNHPISGARLSFRTEIPSDFPELGQNS